MRSILKKAGYEQENLPPPVKKGKPDHGEIMQKIHDHYTAKGHYVPYGSVNTASTSYTKNITTNKYPLCMRRFSGYKRRASLGPIQQANAQPPTVSAKPPNAQTQAPPVSNNNAGFGGSDRNIKPLNTTPMLASLLDDNKEGLFSNAKPSAYPLVYRPPQATASQPIQQASILSNLLGGAEGQSMGASNTQADKKPKKVRQRRRTSESGGTPANQGTSAVPTAASLSETVAVTSRKRKKSVNDDIVRELTTKVKLEVSEQQATFAAMAVPDQFVSLQNADPPRPLERKSSVQPGDSQLARLLHTGVDSKRHLQAKTSLDNSSKTPIIKTVSDFFESPKQMEQQALHAEVKGATSVTIKTVKPKKSSDDRKVVKHSASADSLVKDRKLKRSDSMEMKLKESKSLDQPPLSPSRKTVGRVIAKPKAKVVPKMEPTVSLPIKTNEDRASPKEKVKKQASEKKKKTPKSSSAGTINAPSVTPSKKSSKELYGFYGASNLRSLPKIPKRKPGDGQTSPTSPSRQQKSPTEWQRVSPTTANRPMPSKSEELQAAAVNRAKSYPAPPAAAAAVSTSDLKRPALLPTPHTPPIDVAQQQLFPQRKSQLPQDPRNAQHSFAASKYPSGLAGKNRGGVDPSPNSPDELSIVLDTQPVQIPTQPVMNNPASPAPESITRMPKAIPLDHNKSSVMDAPRPILVKQKAASVSRPLTFSPQPMGAGIDDDLMDMALHC